MFDSVRDRRHMRMTLVIALSEALHRDASRCSREQWVIRLRAPTDDVELRTNTAR